MMRHVRRPKRGSRSGKGVSQMADKKISPKAPTAEARKSSDTKAAARVTKKRVLKKRVLKKTGGR
jgi:hypothetical protein